MNALHYRSLKVSGLALLLCLASACGDGVDSERQAEQAYQGLDQAIAKSLQLGFDGFNAASSANIPPQTAPGGLSGTLTITGQVDQGSSDNKGMRLRVGMVDYSDGAVSIPDEEPVDITYRTAADPSAQPALTLSLRNIPTGTLSGTLTGDFQMAGDLEDSVNLNLTMAGEIEENGSGGTQRKAGTTTVVGTATSGDDTFDIDIAL
ncbi:MAG TPA: hypothetical protein VEY30_04455 [Myxococcaceae bacterium]|nr:hypothetical protein [Myxococcaceae bacterium]